MRLLTALAALSLIPVVRLQAQSPSIGGEWDASINTPGGPRSFKIVFVVKGDTVSGTVKRPAGDVPLTGRISGDLLRFSYTVMYNDSALELTVTAKVTGDNMSGTVSFGGQAEDEFSARRSAGP